MTIRNFVVFTLFAVIIGLGLVSTVELETKYLEHNSQEQKEPTKIDKMAAVIVRDGKVDPAAAIQYATWIEQFSYHYNVDPVKILAIMKVESAFNAKAHNVGDGIGLMQVVSSIHKIPPKLLLDPYHNIKAGVKIFAEYRSKSKSFKEALLRYNGTLGVNDVYAHKVMKVYNVYQSEIFMEVL